MAARKTGRGGMGNLPLGLIITILIVFVLGIGVGKYWHEKRLSKQISDQTLEVWTLPEAQLRQNMRQLWEDHVIWTRSYVVATVANAQDSDEAATRLLKNQEDIGNAIKPYYGEESGNKLTSLLKDHILGAVAIIDAAKAKNATKQTAAEQAWFSNADEIAAFLSTANPSYWPQDAVKNMLYDHLNHTKAEVVAGLNRDYPADVIAFDAIHNQALMMADALSGGIIQQFPEKFGR